ncbi:GntR family transcriptional regulator [Dactylosporangium fulvum]|uniref:GntR family transcriptional regulator n=1 Tax=Dactylosporangium fulvum TaxID=53359 RepID=A0ABY5VXD8_9ACTN|nr:GntR family transcriptional regulator [Dactylosporangium fulvum]UWP82382.1 GntR family transcriptional regulator [Dactylosporangium fulvum]
MIGFQLAPRSGVPTYLQLVNQVKHALRLGQLRPGDRLPTAAEVVAALAINPNTVLKAYRELEREGLVAARPGEGTFVLRTLGRVRAADRVRLGRQLDGWLRAARAAGLDWEDVDALFEAARRDAEQEGVA